MKRTLITNAVILDPFGPVPFLSNGAIGIEDSTITEVYKAKPKEKGYDTVIDLKGKVVLPGMINTHTHLYSALAVGMPPPKRVPVNFTQILQEIWWKLDKALDEESMLASFETGLLESLCSGVTTVVDHHSSPNAIIGSTDLLVETGRLFKMNISTAYETSDRDGEECFELAVTENVDALNRYGSHHPYVVPTFGLHASFTLSDNSLKTVAEAVKDIPQWGIHIHLAEDKGDTLETQNRGYRSVVERLDAFGLLNSRGLVIHGLYISAQDIQILHDLDVTLVHNPTSNANNRVGRLPAETINKLSAGLGTDGMQGNMLAEAKEATLIRSALIAGGAPSVDYLKLLFDHNPRIATALFGRPIGHIAAGHQADLAIYDYDPRTDLTADNMGSHILFGLGMPSDVITRGEFRIQDRELLELNEPEMLRHGRAQSRRLWHRMGEL